MRLTALVSIAAFTIILLPSTLNAQAVPNDGQPGTLQNCTDAYRAVLEDYDTNKTGAVQSVTCSSPKGSVLVTATDEASSDFVAAAFNRDPNIGAADVGNKACAVYRTGDQGETYNLSGKDFSQWKKFVKNQCTVGLGTDVSHKLVFATEDQWNAHQLGGVNGADNLCNIAAIAGGLSGTYTAWLSDSNNDAKDRVNNSVFPYFLPDGAGNPAQQVANNFADILDCTNPFCLQSSIRRDENGVQRINREAWTGTASNGVKTGNFCADWTTDNADTPFTGHVNFNSVGWTSIARRTCTFGNIGLYCFQD
jgi:hypothetical protein